MKLLIDSAQVLRNKLERYLVTDPKFETVFNELTEAAEPYGEEGTL